MAIHQNNPDQYIKGVVFGEEGGFEKKAFAAVPLPDCKREQWVLFCSGLCSIHHWECFVGHLASRLLLGHILAPHPDPPSAPILQMHLQCGTQGRSKRQLCLLHAVICPIRVPSHHAAATLLFTPGLNVPLTLHHSTKSDWVGLNSNPGGPPRR